MTAAQDVGTVATTEASRRQLGRRAQILAGTSVGYNVIEAMPFLSFAQRRTGRELGSTTVVADSTQTLLCTYLSAVLLVGLLLNMFLGWWWADPLAALVIAAVATKEGIEAWRGDNCCAPLPIGAEPSGGVCDDGCC